MSVYVDDANIPFRRMTMSHMVASTHSELIAMADKIGLPRKWIQKEGEYNEHFDVCLSMKSKAINNGAELIDIRDLLRLMKGKI